MRRVAVVVLALGLVAAACGDDDEAADLSTCEGVADSTIDLIQDVIDEIEAMSPAEVGALTGGETPESFTAFEERGVELGSAGQTLGCADLDSLVQERAGQLEADPSNGFTQLIVDGTQAGQDIFGRLFRG